MRSKNQYRNRWDSWDAAAWSARSIAVGPGRYLRCVAEMGSPTPLESSDHSVSWLREAHQKKHGEKKKKQQKHKITQNNKKATQIKPHNKKKGECFLTGSAPWSTSPWVWWASASTQAKGHGSVGNAKAKARAEKVCLFGEILGYIITATKLNRI